MAFAAVSVTTPGGRDARGPNWWRRRELNSDPSAVAGAVYMLSRFSFPSTFIAGISLYAE